MKKSANRFMRLSEATGSVEKMTGNKIAVQTLHRWVQRGLAGVRLEVVYIGGHRHTTRRMLLRFFDAVTAAKTGATAKGQRVEPAEVSRRSAARERAERELDGI